MTDKNEMAVPPSATRGFSLAPSSFQEAQEFARLIASSDMVPTDYKGKPGNVLVAVQMGAEVGLPPMQSLQNIAVINGRPCIWGDAAIALARVHPDFENIDESLDGSGEALTAVCHVKRRGQKAQMRTFSVEDAKRAKLWGKKGPWTDYPQRMLQMRARSWAIRDVFADALKGIALREEVMDAIDVPASSATDTKPVQMPTRKIEIRDIPPTEIEPETQKEQATINTMADTVQEAPVEEKSLSEGQARILHKKLADAGIDDALFAEMYGTPFDGLKFADFNAVITWLKANA